MWIVHVISRILKSMTTKYVFLSFIINLVDQQHHRAILLVETIFSAFAQVTKVVSSTIGHPKTVLVCMMHFFSFCLHCFLPYRIPIMRHSHEWLTCPYVEVVLVSSLAKAGLHALEARSAHRHRHRPQETKTRQERPIERQADQQTQMQLARKHRVILEGGMSGMRKCVSSKRSKRDWWTQDHWAKNERKIIRLICYTLRISLVHPRCHAASQRRPSQWRNLGSTTYTGGKRWLLINSISNYVHYFWPHQKRTFEMMVSLLWSQWLASDSQWSVLSNPRLSWTPVSYYVIPGRRPLSYVGIAGVSREGPWGARVFA